MRSIVKHDIFSDSSPERNYWVGFLFADGYIIRQENKQPLIGLGLKSSDSDHVRKFKDFLGTDINEKEYSHHDKRTNKKYKTTSLRVTSYQICNKLEQLGMSGLNTEPSQELLTSRDFWRGVIDGDGCLSYSNNIYYLSLCGGRKLLEEYQKYIKTIVPRCTRNIIKASGKDLYQLNTSKSIAKELTIHLYKNNSISLDRKNKVAQNLIKGGL